MKYLGAHLSFTSSHPSKILQQAFALGPEAHSFAFFIRSRLSWKPAPPIPKEAIDQFHQALQQTADEQFPLDKLVVHGSYLINLASSDEKLRAQSIRLMQEEVERCASLGVSLYVFHPGSRQGADRLTQGIYCIAEGISQVLQATYQTKVKIIVENMCAQGNTFGRTFDELRQILDRVLLFQASNLKKNEIATRLGICLDTCHLFGSGWNLRQVDNCEEMMDAFDQAMGPFWLSKNVLKLFHLNDAAHPFGSNRDAHANIGSGHIGLDVFKWIMNDARFDNLPMILETPRHHKKKRAKDELTNEQKSKCPPSMEAKEEIRLLMSLVSKNR